jgi:hypothetical protein
MGLFSDQKNPIFPSFGMVVENLVENLKMSFRPFFFDTVRYLP